MQLGKVRPLRSVALFALAALILFDGSAVAASADGDPLEEPRLERIGPDVIPRDVVASLAQDKAGFIWVATGDGLVRYDGHHFRPQERESADPATRNLGWIQAMLAGRDGRVWIGTETAGLAVYDPVSGQVSLHRGAPESSHRAAPTITALAEGPDGHIWAGSVAGLDRFDPASGNFRHYRREARPGGLPDERIGALLVDAEGSLWVGNWAGLSRLRRGSEQFETVDWMPKTGRPHEPTIVTALFQASDGRIWIGSQRGDLAIFDSLRGRTMRFEAAGEAAASGRGSISSFVEIPGRQVWVGSSAGIDAHGIADGRLLRRLRHDPRNPSGLAGNHISSMLLDRAGYVWVGGFGLGLQRHNPNNRNIWVRGPDLDRNARLAEADFRGLLQLDNGEIWASTPNQGVLVMDGRLQVVDALDPPASNPGRALGRAIRPQRIDAMTQAPDGTVWLGGPSRVSQYSRQRKLLRTVPLSTGQTNRLLVTEDGSLWLATQDGLLVLRPGATRLLRITRKGGSALTGQVFVLAETADKSLWVGSATGLFRIEPGSDELLAVEERDGKGLANPTVIGLLVDRDGVLWVDTAVAGLHRLANWDGRHAEFDRISERHGIVNRPFGANLLQDGRGRIWSHMYVYDPAADRLDELSAADGVNIGTGWFRSYAKAADGRLLFGGSKGLLVVRAEPFDKSDFAPQVAVTELRIDGIRQRSEHLANGLTLDADRRGFSIEFAALDFSDAKRNRYAYMLQGFDPRWIETGSNFRVASYSNLDPGNYQLRIRATNRSGVWSPNELAIAVHVVPAWWQHWGFQAVLLLLLAAIIYGLVQWRTRKLRGGKLALEHMVGARTAELEKLTLALQRESAALEEASLTDPLSGLRNRRFLSLHVEADTTLAVRRYETQALHGHWPAEDSDLIFFLVDIDHFKQVNDQHGHAAGDAVIMQIRSRLQKVFRDSDYLIRWGGEEFLILARGTSRSNAARLAERVLHAVAEQAFEVDHGVLLNKTCSIGFSCFPLAPEHPRALDWNAAIKLADASLLAVKSSGRNGWLGLIEAQADSDEDLRSWLDRPLVDWWRSGRFDIAFSASYSGFSAPSSPN